MTVKIAINGFGRIGRLAFRQLFGIAGYDIVAINDLADAEMLAYLLKYDSTQGKYERAESVRTDGGSIFVGDIAARVFQEADAANLPWAKLGVDIVIDSSGAYLSKAKAQTHIAKGAKKVVLSAPAGADVTTVVYGVNEHIISPDDNIISAASCSTNALAPIVKTLNDYAAIQSGIMTVVHGFTSTQMILDNPQRKRNLRRSRTASVNIIPTTAEAAAAVGAVIPELNGKLIGSAVRVPVPVGCFITFIAVINGKNISARGINEAMRAVSSEVIGYTEEELVSSDIVGLRYAALFDATQTMVSPIGVDSYQVRVAAWFDNETSFTSQMLRTVKYFAKYL